MPAPCSNPSGDNRPSRLPLAFKPSLLPFIYLPFLPKFCRRLEIWLALYQEHSIHVLKNALTTHTTQWMGKLLVLSRVKCLHAVCYADGMQGEVPKEWWVIAVHWEKEWHVWHLLEWTNAFQLHSPYVFYSGFTMKALKVGQSFPLKALLTRPPGRPCNAFLPWMVVMARFSGNVWLSATSP